ncbi:MAG: Cna B-type domain-containing protein, partial [Atopostipes suicloacalis]|nr:Cna B-type domain-containing protein [Atopostipes suicloacalis]
MKIFKKLKKKLGVLAILGLLFQTAMPIYQNIAFAQEQESIEQEQVNENADVHKDADPTVEPTGQGDSEVPVNEAEESEEKDSEAAENTEKEKSDSDLAAEEKKKIKSTEIKAEKAEAAPTADPVDLGNIFTFDSLTKNEEEIVNGAVVDVSDGDSIELKYSWNTEGMDVKSGDFAETDIPDAFKFTRDMDGDVTLSSGEKVGTFTIIDNKLRFEFDEGKETHGQVSNGTFTFRADFNLEKFEKDVVEEIIFEGKEDKSLTVIGKPSKEIKSINKEGIPDADKDAKEITWTVDIANPSEEAITNASFTDVIPEGLELNENSIKVNDLTVGLDGKLTQGDNFTVNPAIDGQNLDIPFDKIDPYKGYRVEYTTTITDNSITQFTNEANLVDGETKLPAKSTVNIERSDYVEKYGSELDNGNVEWTIDVNKAGGSIDEAIIEDDLPAGLNIESIEIFNLIQDGDNWNESESDKDADKFPINLGKITSDDAYRIKVESSIDYSKVNDGNYEQATKFINEATLKDGETELDKDDASVNIVRAAILSKKGSDVEIDHDEGKKLDWKVTVNEANHKIDNAVVTDTLPAGLTIDKSDIVVKKGDEGVTDNVTITVPDNDGENPTEVTINLGEITEEYTITYSTKVTDFSKDDFTNDATLGGTGIGPGDSTDSDKTEVKGNYYNKKSTARDADKQIISWENEVNPYREAITELVITDTFPKKGLFLLEDSVKIKIGDDELEETDFTLSSDSSYKEGFKIEFDDSVFPIEEKMKIKYDTSYNLKDVDPNEANNKNIYYNEVNFTGKTVNDTEIDEDREDTVKVGETTVNSGKKLGKLVSLDEDGNQVDGWHSGNERKLEWEVYTNYLEQDLGEDITVEDVLGYNGEVDIDNLEVKKYTVNKKGETTLGDAIDASEYDAEATDDGFTLNFNEAVSERYAIVFTTNVPEISKGVYENTATTKVGDEEYPYTGSIDFDKSEKNLSKKAIGIEGNEVFTDDEINWEIKINEDLSIIQEDVKVVDTISAGMEYKNDSLEIFKLEGTDEVKVDSSAYDLDVRHKDDGKTELRVDFKDTISSTYVLKYTTVVTETDGEVNNEVNFTGKNFKTTSVESEKLSAEQFSSTSGDKTRGKIVVEKVDNNDENIKLSGAGFKLHYLFNDEKRYIETEDGEDIHYTDNNGILEFLGLQTKRTYFLEEISAPEGYEILNDEVIEIDDLEALSVTPKGHIETIGNGKLIEVSGNKTWKDENKDQRPDSITVELSADGEFIDDQEISPDEEGNWNYKFTGLAKYDAEGNEINYTIEELDVEGYEATVTGHNIENVREAKTSVAGHKIWKDEEPTDRPDSIEVSLTREVKGEADNDFSKTQTVKPDNQGNWVYEFAELDEFDENGVAYTYIIEEDTVPKGYESSVEGHDITNVRIGETEVEGTKRWKDDKVDDRPNSVTVNLLRNNVVIDSKDIT